MHVGLISHLFLAALFLSSFHEAVPNTRAQHNDLRNRYDSIEVRPFAIEPGVDLPPEYVQSMMAGVIMDLRRIKKFNSVFAPGDAKQGDTARAVKSCAAGDLTVEIPFNELRGLLKPDGALRIGAV